jgi:hypothetical protein
MLNRSAVADTLVEGCDQGAFVLSVTRPDRSRLTFWRQRPPDWVLQDDSLEVVLPQAASLESVDPALLDPGGLPSLWTERRLPVSQLLRYFTGGKFVDVPRDGYQESIGIPDASASVINKAVIAAVENGVVCVVTGRASFFRESLPEGLAIEESTLWAPPAPLAGAELLPEVLADAWTEGTTTPAALTDAISARREFPAPWFIVREAIESALRTRLLEVAPGPGRWSTDYAESQRLALRVRGSDSTDDTIPHPSDGTLSTEAELRPNELQDLR